MAFLISTGNRTDSISVDAQASPHRVTVVGGVTVSTQSFTGAFVVNAHGGDDAVLVTGGEPATVDGGPGDDTIDISLTNSTTIKIFGRGGEDSIVGTPNTLQAAFEKFWRIHYGPGNDTGRIGDSNTATLEGGKGDDRISVGNHNAASVEGGEGGDTIHLGDSNGGSILGKEGDDHITLGESNNVEIDGGPGGDTIILGDRNTVELHGAGGKDSLIFSMEEFARIFAGPGADTIRLFDRNGGSIHGNEGNDRITLGDSNNVEIDGGPGDDTMVLGDGNRGFIEGGEGSDHIIPGDSDAETIDGGPGDDTVDGGNGSDRITGGAGKDRYIFHFGHGIDGTIQGGWDVEIADPSKKDTFVFDSGGTFKSMQQFLTGLNVTVSDDGMDVRIQFSTTRGGSVAATFDGIGTGAISTLKALGKQIGLAFV